VNAVQTITMQLSDFESDEAFREQCRRQMQRSLEVRIKYGFNRVHRPVLDDAPWRSFDSMSEYRAWCAANLPEYLGFKPAA
jgi:hypothetical protein